MINRHFLLASFIVLGATTFGHASGEKGQQKKPAFSGVTLSAGLGYAMGSIKEIQTQNTPAGNGEVGNARLNGGGALGELAVGYGDVVAPCFYLGGDFYVALSGLKTSHKISTAADINTTVKSPFSFGFRARPGWMVSPKTVLHGTLGLGWAQWKMSASQDDIGLDQFASASANKTLFGFSYGLGVMTKLRQNLIAGLEFIHTDYYQAPSLNQVSRVNPANSLTQSFKPSTNTALFRLTYQF